MCGIAGRIDGQDSWTRDQQTAALTRACDLLRHRGPDDDGHWLREGVALGHTRLAVIDLRNDAAQPMTSTDGRWTVVFNGEIYNYRHLRSGLDLSDPACGDARVLVELISRHGVHRALPQLDGMFAFAAWDDQDRTLWLARDALGEKPLCYAADPSSTSFASTLDALAPMLGPGHQPSIDPGAFSHYLTFGYTLSPRSILEGVSKVEPGHVVRIPHTREGTAGTPEATAWWTPPQSSADDPSMKAKTEDALVASATRLLSDVVASRTVADVPVGAFLSGGVDSTLITALMAERGADIRTFTARFDDPAYDESALAASTARALGTTHTELDVSTAKLLSTVPDLAAIYDEPFADSSQIPTVAIAREARQHVTVVLTGDGADEVFGGYERYRLAEGLLGGLARAPVPLRQAAAAALRTLATTDPERLAGRVVDRGLAGVSRPRVKLAKAAAALDVDGLAAAYRSAVAVWPDAVLEIAPALADGQVPLGRPGSGEPSSFRDLMAIDLATYLPGDLLTKVDRAAMSTSLETRAPFLAPEVVSWAAGLPSSALRRGADNKWILRAVLDRVLPGGYDQGPKMGFGVPLDVWLRGPLKEWCAQVIAQPDDLLDQAAVGRVWMSHLAGQDRGQQVWAIVMWRSWAAHRSMGGIS